MGLLHLTTHEDRVEIDRAIELRTGVYCDDAVDRGLITKQEFEKITRKILDQKRKRKENVPLIA
jgi:hypothetical protein